ncbi:hypothetical protein FNU76_00965 [Chitinimonas arctica]|uniref:Insecticide toxin TcdB middle/N-terminal domain-containing protein n=1 Tax=Chitinimonas arctica TaxID=2594795 RepID=A0A516SA54_9NEIS|nr:RHS repeat-associated core domain-containing protein [Chitinimonas arctica]QDQ25033.1 hypothetical protein FNU76_00965 [Chitinimonas arctica]
MRKAGVAHRLAVPGNTRGTDWLARLGALLVGVTVLAAPPTINVQRTPTPLIAGQPYSVSWSTSNANSVTFECTAAGTGFAGTGTVGTSGSAPGTASAAWVGYPSRCIWTAKGPDGSAAAPDYFTTVAAAPAPTINLQRVPSPMVAGQPYNLTWSTANATAVSLSCTASGTGYTVSNLALATSGNIPGTASAAWVGYPSSCTWTATGPGGSSSKGETLTTVKPPAPTITVQRNPTTMTAGQAYTSTWSTTNATAVSLSCTASGTGYTVSNLALATSGNIPSTASAAWVGYPSSCTWTATGPGGSTSSVEILNTVAGANPARPTATLSASPSNVRIAAGQTAAITLTGSGSDVGGQVAKLELLLDSGSGYSATPLKTVPGTTPTASLSHVHNLPAGFYRFKLRATDNQGASTDSTPVPVNITTSPLLGSLSGIRSSADGKAQLVGWTCQAGTAQAMSYQVFLNAPTQALGGVPIGTANLANLSDELDNAAVQAACGTPSVGHSLRFDLSPYTSSYAGSPIFVQATAPSGSLVLPCEDRNCTMPGSLRIALTTPADGAVYKGVSDIFMRIKLSNGTGSCDDVSFLFDGAWLGKAQGVTADSEAGTCYVTKRGAAPRAAPYLITARIQQGNTTLYAAHRYVQVIPNTTISLSSPEAGKTLTAPASITLNATATVGSGSITRVEFYNGSTKLGEDSSAPYSYSWMAVPVGNYANLTAKLVDSLGGVTTSAPVAVTVTASQGGGGDTPVKISFASSYVDGLITGGVDAGSLPGELSVGGGAASYSLPIAVPPGTAGLAPSLSLNYNSNGSSGLAGLGWSLSGRSSVQRCSRSIAQDGEHDTVRFDTRDRLCLDGQRLVLVNLAMSDANYWAENAQYRTEIDSFSRISRFSANGKLGFKVETKAGQIQYFGVNGLDGQANSYVQAQGKTEAISWALDRVEDRAGNRMTLGYLHDLSTGENLPAWYRYGGHATTNADVIVRLGYETRPDNTDNTTGWGAGGKAYLLKRLKTITTAVNTAANGDGGEIASVYTLGYTQSPRSARSLLRSVKRCDGAGRCLPATTFQWGEPAAGTAKRFVSLGNWDGPILEDWVASMPPPLHSSSEPPEEGNDPLDMIVMGDFNGDGYTDMLDKRRVGGRMHRLFLGNGRGFDSQNVFTGQPAAFTVLETGDFDGDGQLDLLGAEGMVDGYGVVRSQFFSKRQLCYARFREGQGFTCSAWAEADAIAGGNRSGLPTAYDFNGDGRTDILLPGSVYSSEVGTSSNEQLCLSSGNAFSCRLLASGQFDLGQAGPLLARSYSGDSADINGDGRADPLRLTRASFDTERRNWIDTHTGVWGNIRSEKGAANHKVADFIELSVQKGSPTGFFLARMAVFAHWQSTLVADFNHDGYTDLLFGLEGGDKDWLTGGRLCYATGEAAARLDCRALADTGYRLSGAGPDQVDFRIKAVGDIDGDGEADILAGDPYGGAQRVCRITGSAGYQCESWTLPQVPYPTTPPGRPAFLGARWLEMSRFLTGDFNGDGRMDLVNYTPGGKWEVFSAESTAQPGEALDKLLAVTDGTLRRSQVEYGSLRDSNLYLTSAAALDPAAADTVRYPLRRIAPGPTKVVSKLRIDNGVADPIVTSYRYAAGAVELTGRANPGFRVIETTAQASGIRSLITTRQDPAQWQSRGMLERKRTLAASGAVLSETTADAQVRTLAQPNGSPTWFVYSGSEIGDKYDLDRSPLGHTVTANSYDDWGNLKQSDSLISGNGKTFRNLTVNTYQAANAGDAPWLQGLLSRTVNAKTDGYGQTISRTVAYGYDAKGLPASETLEPNDASLKLKLLTTFDRSGNPFGLVNKKTQTWRDPVSNNDRSRTVEDVQYDAKGRFVKTRQNAAGHSESLVYDFRTGAQTSLTGPNGFKTTWTVDGFGRKLAEQRADGTETRSYLKQCNGSCPVAGAMQVAITDSYKGADRIAVPSLVYSDNAGHALRSQSWGFAGQVINTDHSYDRRGRLEISYQPAFAGSTPLQASRYGYDDLDRVILVATLNEGGGVGKEAEQVTTTIYQGLQTVLTNPKPQSKTDIRNVLGQLEVSKDAKGGITEYGHDAFGNLTQIIDPGKNIVRITYDLLGRKTDLNDLDLGAIHYDVDPLGRVWKQTDAKQQVTRSTYDDLDRLTSRSEPNLESRWVYDTAARGIGQLTEAYTLRSGTKDYQRTHSYDSLGRPDTTTLTLDTVYSSKAEYDAWGRSLRQTHQRGTDASKAKRFEQRYNQYGYLHKIVRQGSALWEATKQDAANRVIEVKLGNGLKVTQTYNVYTGRLSDGELTSPQTGLQWRENYLYDKLGNIEQRSQFWADSSLTESFAYDDLNRLSKATAIGTNQPVQEFSYDAIGNMLSKTGVGTYTYPPQGQAVRAANSGGPHAVSSISSVGAFRYDANGNLIEGAGRKLSWTSFDMPHCITTGSLNADGRCGSGTSSEFAYGTEHQRAKQIKSDGTTIYYAGAIEAETTGSTVKSIKTYWPNGLGVEIDKGSSTDQHWIHEDRLGSVVAISDQTGALKERLSYDAWGKRRNLNGSANNVDGVIDNKGFTGHEMLDGLDLVHMNGRVYDPLVARFMSADPIIQDPEHSQSYNRYSYVWNNPTNLTDPTGFEAAKTVEVTGSRIPRAEGETGSVMIPVAIRQKGENEAGNGSVPRKASAIQGSAANSSGGGAGSFWKGVKEFFTGPDYSSYSDADLAKLGAGNFAGNAEFVRRAEARGQIPYSMSSVLGDVTELNSNALPLRVPGAAVKRVIEGAVEALSSKKTTAIGRMDDLRRVADDPNIDSWAKTGRMPGPGDSRVTWTENKKWLQDRIDRGDNFIILTNPQSLPRVKGGFVEGQPNGYFTARELQYLNDRGIKPKYIREKN